MDKQKDIRTEWARTLGEVIGRLDKTGARLADMTPDLARSKDDYHLPSHEAYREAGSGENFVLPFLVRHFADRYPEEHILIYDETHGQALVYRPYEAAIIPMDEFRAAPPDAEEQQFRSLWQTFYDAIEIRPRHNEKCRMTLMPKRYWRYMTEFARQAPRAAAVPVSMGKQGADSKNSLARRHQGMD